MRCIECGATVKKTSDPIAVEFRGENLTIRGFEHYKCTKCGEVIFDSKMNDAYNCAVDDEYRRICGLLAPDEIRAFRNDLGLTQEQFQTLLGVGKLSVCRWETGRLVQSKTVDNLMRAYRSCPHLVEDALERAELGKCAGFEQRPICAGKLAYYPKPSSEKPFRVKVVADVE